MSGNRILYEVPNSPICLNCGSDTQLLLSHKDYVRYVCKICGTSSIYPKRKGFCSACFSRLGIASQLEYPICSNPICPRYQVKTNSCYLAIQFDDITIFSERGYKLSEIDNLIVNKNILNSFNKDYYPEFLSSILRCQHYEVTYD